MRGKKIRNPVALAFGAFFQRKRQSLHLTSITVAGPKMLDVGDSTIRSFETGKMLLPIEKTVAIKQLFPEIQYNKLTSIHVAVHYLHDCENQSQVLELIKTLEKNDPILKEAFQFFMPVFAALDKDFNDGLGSMSRLLEEFDVVNQLERFLTTSLPLHHEAQLPVGYVKIVTEHLSNMPSYDADDVLNYLNRRIKQPLVITSQTALEWERNNSDEILEIYGITEKYSAITKIENIQLFDYEYLWKGIYMKVIYLDETALSDEVTVKNEFFSNLELVLKKNKDKRFKDLNKKRAMIEFKRAKKNDTINNILKTDFFSKELQFNNFWAYTLKDEHLIGFLATDQDGNYTYLGISPSQSALREKVKAFTNLWESL